MIMYTFLYYPREVIVDGLFLLREIIESTGNHTGDLLVNGFKSVAVRLYHLFESRRVDLEYEKRLFVKQYGSALFTRVNEV